MMRPRATKAAAEDSATCKAKAERVADHAGATSGHEVFKVVQLPSQFRWMDGPRNILVLELERVFARGF